MGGFRGHSRTRPAGRSSVPQDSLDRRHIHRFPGKLLGLLGRLVDPVEDRVAVDPGADAPQFAGRKLGIVMPRAQQADRWLAGSPS